MDTSNLPPDNNEQSNTHLFDKGAFVSAAIAAAKKYVGQTEILGNRGFVDPSFEQKMKDVGFVSGYAWCCLFMELVYKEGAKAIESEALFELFDKLFSPSTVKTFMNFTHSTEALEYFEFSTKPEVGSLILFRNYTLDGRPADTGHIGIVVEKLPENRLLTIEGNTNNNGSSEGIDVEYKKRYIDLAVHNGRLNLIGFINVK